MISFTQTGTLDKHFPLKEQQAESIILQCHDCQATRATSCPQGTNPQGLVANVRWQTDITRASSFGKLCYVHVSIDKYSGYIFASTHVGESQNKTSNICLWHFLIWESPMPSKQTTGQLSLAHHLRDFALFGELLIIQESLITQKDQPLLNMHIPPLKTKEREYRSK